MKQYLDLCKRIVKDGVWINNTRTKTKCLTVINVDLVYDVGYNIFPLITTRKSYYKSAIAELLGYIRGYTNAKDFRTLGAKTWDANSNLNQIWIDNPFRKGTDDMGKVYGSIGRNMNDVKIFKNLNNEKREFLQKINYKRVHIGKLESCEINKVHGGTFDGTYSCKSEDIFEIYTRNIDQLRKVVDNLTNSIDDRFETITFYDPSEIDFGCLRPCMYSHTFSLIGDTLHLTSYQRSCDVPLGLNFNQVQCFTFLAVIAQITGHKAGIAYHKIINAHIYEDQLSLMECVQLKREPFNSPQLKINPNIKTLEDLETWVTIDDFTVLNYQSHEPIKYPFSV